MKVELNVKGAIAFCCGIIICAAVLMILGHNLIDIFAALALLTFIALVGYVIDKAGFGKYFGGKT